MIKVIFQFVDKFYYVIFPRNPVFSFIPFLSVRKRSYVNFSQSSREKKIFFSFFIATFTFGVTIFKHNTHVRFKEHVFKTSIPRNTKHSRRIFIQNNFLLLKDIFHVKNKMILKRQQATSNH